MKFEATSKIFGDCTADYNVSSYKAKTVSEFIEEVMKERSDEWGAFSIDSLKYCEYKQGKLLGKIPERHLNKEIAKVTSNGGWFCMNYNICTKEAAIEQQHKLEKGKANPKKTIKEMAKEYGEANPNIVYSADDVSDDTESPALDFEAGANAVLGEIDNLMRASQTRSYREIYNDLEELIKQLKGK